MSSSASPSRRPSSRDKVEATGIAVGPPRARVDNTVASASAAQRRIPVIDRAPASTLIVTMPSRNTRSNRRPAGRLGSVNAASSSARIGAASTQGPPAGSGTTCTSPIAAVAGPAR